MLEANLKTQLNSYLERLSQPVEIVAAADESEKSREMLELLEDIVSLSPLISVVPQRDEPQLKPSFALRRVGQEPRVRFAGVPMGHEFTSLVLALLQTGGHPPKADPASLERVRGLAGEFNFETFVSLSCQSCPEVVQALNLMAVSNPNVRHTMIDGALFQNEVERRGVMAVPAVFLNGEPFGQGRMELNEILAKIESQSKIEAHGPLDARRSNSEVERLNAKPAYDVLMVGGGPAGAAAAVYAARKGIRTGLAAERLGGQLLDTVSIEKREYRNRGVAYCPHCDGPLFKGKRVAVIGGGNSGVEAAIDLAGLVSHVTVIEYDAQLRADAVLKRKLASLGNVSIVTSAETTEVLGNGRQVTGLIYRDRQSGGLRTLELAGVFVQIVIAMGEGAKASLGAFDHLIRSPLPVAA